ncbi:4Fe-4S ferredoxin, iron-sulphur binding, conserved site [Acididesulfobacillus acetoxydans]|uniref:4Fe-4S ferredoxin, iron-sulphur binding, conserved site n=1 Tax=Acididesulfobacillus acetoxydans TaxID=1561005 RepID=A0A8S0X498_9FIRM|nr:anaerobic glycerol-3-phosphate dehydrogenase subunit C [Acididesulfobacillus acetoxydans]CAA7600650.1 4Fe-4S ferredoxin, iron-sulphur binding, conserved site [Acididesulfobacillus acetoxydans]CEJ09431.1 Anaerobic glycerol-3-phosphate dehydrogenase subunit C [Acididesulfobacillus acetoxydans]
MYTQTQWGEEGGPGPKPAAEPGGDDSHRQECGDPAGLDACVKCGICTAHCPVARAYAPFPGPKNLGPDAERLRLEGVALDPGCLAYCTNCKTCEVVCPSGVRITDMILRARRQQGSAQAESAKSRLRIRDHVLGRAEYLGRLGTVWPEFTNTVLATKLTRRLLQKALGISAEAPLPKYKKRFRLEKGSAAELTSESGQNGGKSVEGTGSSSMGRGAAGDPSAGNGSASKQVVYFPGCFVNYNDEATGLAVIRVLEHNGFEVIVPGFHCCGVPLTANGRFREAEGNARRNLALMEPYLERGIPIITSCTSCGLALKEDYPRIRVPAAKRIGAQTYDLFEFLWLLHERGELKEDFLEVRVPLAYHAPCHLKAQGIGTPSLRILRLIPGVKAEELDAGCCGLSGSFGFKAEKYELSLQIGHALFQRVRQGMREGKFKAVITECGGCQVQIAQGSGARSLHPVWILAQAYGLGGGT